MPTFGSSPSTEDWTNQLVLSDNYTDIDNNTGSGATSPNFMVDDVYPIVHGSPTISLRLDNVSGTPTTLLLWYQTSDTTYHSGRSGNDNISVLRVDFPEPVIATYNLDNSTDNESSFSSADHIRLDNATGLLATMIPETDNQSIWWGRFTPTNNMEVDSNTITLSDNWTDLSLIHI